MKYISHFSGKSHNSNKIKLLLENQTPPVLSSFIDLAIEIEILIQFRGFVTVTELRDMTLRQWAGLFFNIIYSIDFQFRLRCLWGLL